MSKKPKLNKKRYTHGLVKRLEGVYGDERLDHYVPYDKVKHAVWTATTSPEKDKQFDEYWGKIRNWKSRHIPTHLRRQAGGGGDDDDDWLIDDLKDAGPDSDSEGGSKKKKSSTRRRRRTKTYGKYGWTKRQAIKEIIAFLYEESAEDPRFIKEIRNTRKALKTDDTFFNDFLKKTINAKDAARTAALEMLHDDDSGGGDEEYESDSSTHTEPGILAGWRRERGLETDGGGDESGGGGNAGGGDDGGGGDDEEQEMLLNELMDKEKVDLKEILDDISHWSMRHIDRREYKETWDLIMNEGEAMLYHVVRKAVKGKSPGTVEKVMRFLELSGYIMPLEVDEETILVPNIEGKPLSAYMQEYTRVDGDVGGANFYQRARRKLADVNVRQAVQKDLQERMMQAEEEDKRLERIMREAVLQRLAMDKEDAEFLHHRMEREQRWADTEEDNAGGGGGGGVKFADSHGRPLVRQFKYKIHEPPSAVEEESSSDDSSSDDDDVTFMNLHREGKLNFERREINEEDNAGGGGDGGEWAARQQREREEAAARAMDRTRRGMTFEEAMRAAIDASVQKRADAAI